jgi:hypothetical protein
MLNKVGVSAQKLTADWESFRLITNHYIRSILYQYGVRSTCTSIKYCYVRSSLLLGIEPLNLLVRSVYGVVRSTPYVVRVISWTGRPGIGQPCDWCPVALPARSNVNMEYSVCIKPLSFKHSDAFPYSPSTSGLREDLRNN